MTRQNETRNYLFVARQNKMRQDRIRYVTSDCWQYNTETNLFMVRQAQISRHEAQRWDTLV